jgi:hypothetical protein
MIAEDLAILCRDPLRAALYIWPGLELRTWQVEWFTEVGRQLQDQPFMPVQTSRASGHGIGKSTGIAILNQALFYTRENTRGVITANTDTQLRTKTWPEWSKWYGAAIQPIRDWFALTATRLHRRGPLEVQDRWRIDATPWSEHNTEAFQGLHNARERILISFDEASAIADKVHEAADGVLTDEETEIIWTMMGNPTRTTGRFRDSFGKFGHVWRHANIDSRTVEGTNKAVLQRMVDAYGEDSDYARIRVRGMFPRASSMQFIDGEVVARAKEREPAAGLRDPLVMGIDIARGGDDNLVICYRRGLDAKSIPWIVIPGSETRDSERVIAKIADLANTEDRFRRPDAIFVDATGIGGPITDRLRNLLGDDAQVYPVTFSEASPDPQYANVRAYIWKRMREKLRVGLAIPNDDDLERDLTSVEFYHDKKDRVLLEAKEHMKERGLASPDRADALAVTCFMEVQPTEQTYVSRGTNRSSTVDYNPIERER